MLFTSIFEEQNIMLLHVVNTIVAYGFCDVDERRKGATVRHAVSDRPCPRLTPSVMPVPQSNQGTGELSYRQIPRPSVDPSVELDTSITTRANIDFLLSYLLQQASGGFSADTLTSGDYLFTSMRVLHILF